MIDTNQDAPYRKAVRALLRGLNASSPDIEASAAISTDGLVIDAVLGDNIDRERFGAMCASLLALAERAGEEIGRGRLKQVLVEGENGTMLLVHCGDDAVLAIGAKSTANLGMLFISAKAVAAKVQSYLKHDW